MNKQLKMKKKEKERELTHFQLNLQTYTQLHTPTVVLEGSMEPFPGDFDMLQYFKTILPVTTATMFPFLAAILDLIKN